MPKGDLTKRTHSVDLHSRCFAYVGDESDTSTWHCCIHVLGDPAKTINAIKNSLSRFAETKGIPDSEREAVWHTVRGAALAYGIPVQERAKSQAPSQTAEPMAEPKMEAHRPLSDRKLDELTLLFDRQADLFLRQLGID